MARESCAEDREALWENKNGGHWLCLAESKDSNWLQIQGGTMFFLLSRGCGKQLRTRAVNPTLLSALRTEFTGWER